MIRFLADMGVSMTTVGELQSRGFDVVHLRDQQLIRMPDDEIVLKRLLRVIDECGSPPGSGDASLL